MLKTERIVSNCWRVTIRDSLLGPIIKSAKVRRRLVSPVPESVYNFLDFTPQGNNGPSCLHSFSRLWELVEECSFVTKASCSTYEMHLEFTLDRQAEPTKKDMQDMKQRAALAAKAYPPTK